MFNLPISKLPYALWLSLPYINPDTPFQEYWLILNAFAILSVFTYYSNLFETKNHLLSCYFAQKFGLATHL